MAIEVLSNAVYHGAANQGSKPKAEAATGSDVNSSAINITEEVNTSKVAGSSQSGKEQNNAQGRNDGQGNAKKEGMASEQQIKSAISQANNKMKTHRTRCEFSYHEETRRVSIKVLDEDTKELIREIPPEETLEMVQKMWEMAGLLVDEKR